MNIAHRAMVLAGLVFALMGCTVTGTGGGELSGANAQPAPVEFSWTSKDAGMTGTMTAQIGPLVFEGRFFQITQQTRVESLGPLWSHWNQGWYDWPYAGGPWSPPYPQSRFITTYTGKVLATLEATGQAPMRCRFHLVEPAMGMRGGGEGECQLAPDKVVRAVFAGR